MPMTARRRRGRCLIVGRAARMRRSLVMMLSSVEGHVEIDADEDRLALQVGQIAGDLCYYRFERRAERIERRAARIA